MTYVDLKIISTQQKGGIRCSMASGETEQSRPNPTKKVLPTANNCSRRESDSRHFAVTIFGVSPSAAFQPFSISVFQYFSTALQHFSTFSCLVYFVAINYQLTLHPPASGTPGTPGGTAPNTQETPANIGLARPVRVVRPFPGCAGGKEGVALLATLITLHARTPLIYCTLRAVYGSDIAKSPHCPANRTKHFCTFSAPNCTFSRAFF